MKGIKFLLILLVCALMSTCSEQEEKYYSNDEGRFVRFFALVNSNNDLLEFPEINGRLQTVSFYEKNDIKTLKIPVALTSEALSENVTVQYETTVSAGLENIQITPVNAVSFAPGRLVDTIFVSFAERWDASLNPEIKFILTQTSVPDINVGMPNSNVPNDELTIGLGNLNLTYSFEKSREEILGAIGETFDFKILFANGFIASEIEDVNLFGISSAFDISIEQQPITNNTEITYTATVNENLPEDSSYDALLNLIEIEGYTLGTITSFQITKPSIIPRSGNPASNFYDVSDQFYRLRGDYWRTDDDNPGGCEWFSHNVFSVPVIVEPDNPDAILFDNMGTNNEEDDIYHHRFKIGFVGPNPPIGTNPFALRNLLEGESNISPGLNLIESIEFFPENGNSSTQGTMAVISQIVVIVRNTDDAVFNVPLSGSGTYQLMDASTNLWRMDFEVTYDFSAINGTIKTLPFLLYNQSGQPEPELPTADCFEPIDL